ncbi:tricarballylate utilization 4Fe-4S protein TcuB [Pigmentiphaga soli]|uniref:Tricarballylate utilization 4Fe-4S protein TcuB n=1 Tax=Pigmentiphaga soli TaxID=1007095 RepID=A0ABP8H167_9BURK
MQQLDDLVREAQRTLTICNACRYCEGFCAVFPAMERRLQFTPGDIHYLANLCHNCGECYYSCQYAPPNEFAVNIPQVLAQVRGGSYRRYAWPGPLAALFDRNGLFASLALAVGIVGALLIAVAVLGSWDALLTPAAGGNFYQIIPHNVMATAFGLVALFVLLALVIGFSRFWRDAEEAPGGIVQPGPLGQALDDALSLRYLHGNGNVGCTYPRDDQSNARRWFHHFTFYGFMACFAATCVGTIYHYVFDWHAPYGLLSLPVILGTLGGIGLVIGPAGLLYLKLQRDPNTADVKQTGMDVAFIVQLLLTSISGLALLAFRETSFLGLLLVIHLGIVMALFVTLPYGKFVHGMYRLAALLKNALEARRPNLGLGGEG